MNLELKSRIYQAQSIGNIEPIEHMVPYPNLRSLIDGQNIKYGAKIVYNDLNISSSEIYALAQQTANWLVSMGVNPNDRVLIKEMLFPRCEILAYGIWTLGASLVISSNGDLERASMKTNAKIVITNENFIDEIKNFSKLFEPTFKPLLEHEAMVFIQNEEGYQYSNYNLLVNTNGIQQAINLYDDQTFFVDLRANSMQWLILQVILPLYSGSSIAKKNPDISFNGNNRDFIICNKWEEIKETNPPTLYVCYENTGFISINTSPIHLTKINKLNKPLSFSGHSVMMGYLDNKKNEKSYKDGSISIEK